MNLKKCARCHIRMDSSWAYLSAVSMGLSVFIRTAYYFGLVNLRDLGGFAVVTNVVIPMMIAAAYLIMLKGFRLNAPALLSGLIGAYALNNLILMTKNVACILGGITLVAAAALFILTGLGYISSRTPILACAAALALFRVLVIDFIGFVFPLGQFQLIAYLPEASNLFGFLSVALLAPALHLTALQNADSTQAETNGQDGQFETVTIA